MSNYIIAIKTAFILFPFIAVFITFPYMIFQYRKYGSIPFLRSVILYSFILCTLCMYLLVILPLPSAEEVKNYTSPTVQPIPFQFIRDFKRETVLNPLEPSTWLLAVKQNCFLQVIFNILLFVPFGIYMRYYFKCNLKKVLLISFSVSLFFELTQLSGLYGIYPRGYRLFDVDDLILNTSGGIIGGMIEPIIAHLLPSRMKLDEMAYKNGKKVSFIRRWIAFMIDITILGVISILGSFIMGGIYFIFVLYITKGYTPGKWVLKIRVVDKNGNPPSLSACIMRNGILYLGIFLPVIMIGLILIGKLLEKRNKKQEFFYECLSNTKCISVIENVYSYQTASL